MLKISIVEGRKQLRLILEGKLIGPWVDEVRAACEKAQSSLGERELVVELWNITSISEEGEKGVLDMMRQGIKIRCRGVFTKRLLRQLSRKFRDDSVECFLIASAYDRGNRSDGPGSGGADERSGAVEALKG
jgi:hypothetical protein